LELQQKTLRKPSKLASKLTCHKSDRKQGPLPSKTIWEDGSVYAKCYKEGMWNKIESSTHLAL
jgi:hypothetical protein